MRRGIRLLVPALVLTAGATACSDDPTAGTLPTTSPTNVTPTSAVPTPTQPEDLGASLEAALRSYFDALYAAGMDPAGKTDALAKLIDASCECRRVVDVLREEARQGRHIDYRYTLNRVQVLEATVRGGDIKYTVTRSAGAERDATGRVIERYEATVEDYTARFVRRDERWLLAQLTRFK